MLGRSSIGFTHLLLLHSLHLDHLRQSGTMTTGVPQLEEEEEDRCQAQGRGG
jgi:hypothetical protein